MVAIQKKLGETIRNLRKEKGLTQEQLAIKADMDLTSINETENGKRNPSVQTLHKITKALGVKLADIFK